MNQGLRHIVLGLLAGMTVFAIVVPPTHLMAAMASWAGLELEPWDNPAEVFLFIMTSTFFGVVPWGLWIFLTDARRGNMFNEGREVVQYLLAALGVFLTLTLLVCTRLQSVYAQFRWFITPALLICAVALLWWRWRQVWRFPKRIGVRGILDQALALDRVS